MMRHSICTFTLAMAGSLIPGAGAQHRTGNTGTAGLNRSQTSSDNLEKHLADNPNLASRVQPLLPPGTSLQAAVSGFKDEGQFIAALHVSRNLNIPFKELKADLANNKYGSLGRALQDLRPELHSKVIDGQVKKAERQARADLQFAGEVAENSGPAAPLR